MVLVSNPGAFQPQPNIEGIRLFVEAHFHSFPFRVRSK